MPLISQIAQKWHGTISQSSLYLRNSLKRQGALDAVDRILKYGKNENGDPLKESIWFRQQLRLTADKRIKHLLTTGASQVSKSLGNYLAAIDDLVNLQVNLGWFYASRASMFNQQPEQFQKMIGAWLKGQNLNSKIERESTSRYTVGKATANFSYASSTNQEKTGGATEGKEQASFQASILYLEEKSSWNSTIDVTPRLGASVLAAKPIRELGTPGSGAGIEALISECIHYFCPSVICNQCDSVTWLEPKEALFKPYIEKESQKKTYFDSRGRIYGFYSENNSEDPNTAQVVCIHCNSKITQEQIEKTELRSKGTLQSIDEFLDELPEDQIYTIPVAIYLSPLLRMTDDPYRHIELVKEGQDPNNPSIFQQNKCGYPSSLGVTGVSLEEFDLVVNLPKHNLIKPIRIGGIDQGRDFHYLTILELDLFDITKKNIILQATLPEDEVINVLNRYNVNFTLIDNEPERKAANDLSTESKGKLKTADQRRQLDAFKKIEVTHGAIKYKTFAIDNILYHERVLYGFTKKEYRFVNAPHKKTKKHVTSISRDMVTGNFIRADDHDDEFFFSLLFCEAGIDIFKTQDKKPGISSFTGKPLQKLKVL